MSKNEMEAMLDEIGIPYSYHHFEVEDAVAPPFICWLTQGSSNFAADGEVYFQSAKLAIELYTDEKDFEKEEQVEQILLMHGIFWSKTELYIESERMYEVLYEMEV